MPSHNLFQTGDVSRVLGISSNSVRSLVARGLLKVAARTRGGEMLFTEAEAQRVAAERAAARAAILRKVALGGEPPRE